MEKIFNELIKAGCDNNYISPSTNVAMDIEGIPQLLRHNSKVTMDNKDELNKVYIHFSPKLGFQFTVRQNSRSRKIDFTLPLPGFKQNWTTLLGGNLLFPGHYTVSSF